MDEEDPTASALALGEEIQLLHIDNSPPTLLHLHPHLLPSSHIMLRQIPDIKSRAESHITHYARYQKSKLRELRRCQTLPNSYIQQSLLSSCPRTSPSWSSSWLRAFRGVGRGMVGRAHFLGPRPSKGKVSVYPHGTVPQRKGKVRELS